MAIPFNKVHFTGKEIANITRAMTSGHISGDGSFTRACERFFEEKYGFQKTLLTSSCTDALELIAILIGIQPGDEVIMPSFTFPSTANAFILQGARIIFADSDPLSPNIDAQKVEPLITPATKAIVAVHYGGICGAIDQLKTLADQYEIMLIEDAAQAIDCFYKNKPLGSYGHLAAFSFHETKNITCGEGGLLVINDEHLTARAEIIRNKGTNRAAFTRNEVLKYDWVDLGSSFLASEISAAFLLAQLDDMEVITNRRKLLWKRYYQGFELLERERLLQRPIFNVSHQHNGHVFYLLCCSTEIRATYVDYMIQNGVQVNTHYQALHQSPFQQEQHRKASLPMATYYRDHLVRLPLFYDLEEKDIDRIIRLSELFFLKNSNDQ